jgi:O-antigen ligase
MKKIFNLENFVYFSILTMPLYLIKVSIFGVPTNLFEIIASLAIVWFVIGAVGSKINLRDHKILFMPIVMIIGGSVLSMLYGGSYRIGLGIIKSWFILPIILAFVAATTLPSKKILEAIYNSAFGVACVAIVYFFLGQVTFDGRLAAIYNSPNYLAMFLAPAIIIGSVLWAERKRYYAFSLAIIISAFYLSFSYAAWAAVLTAVGILFFWQTNGKIQWRKNLAVGLFIVGIMFLQVGTSKFDDLIHLKSRSSLASRLMIWSAAGKIISDNAILGIGLGNFQNKYLEYQKYFPPYLEWAVPQPHNLFLAFWLQTGLLGLVGFLYLLFAWFKNLFKNGNNNKKVSLEKLVVGAIIIYMLIHGLLDTTYFKNDLAVLFWLAIFVGIKKHSASSLDVKRD